MSALHKFHPMAGLSPLPPLQVDGKKCAIDREGSTTLTAGCSLAPSKPYKCWGGLGISPDGGQVFYITADRVGTHGTLFKVSSLGGPPRKLADVANDVGGLSSDERKDAVLVGTECEPDRLG